MVNLSTQPNASPSQPKAPVKNAVPSDSLSRSQPVKDLLCFSHLRWNFVYQRPQHLLSRASPQWRIWYIEEPQEDPSLWMEVRPVRDQIRVVVPYLPAGIDPQTALRLQRQLVNQLIERESLTNFIAWYYTPMALLFSDHLQPRLTVYDCMDELSAFAGASPLLLEQEEKLLRQADVVYTGGIVCTKPSNTAIRACLPFRAALTWLILCPVGSENGLLKISSRWVVPALVFVA